VLHGQWASVAITEVNGQGLVIAPLGDAWVYAFDAKTGKIVWKFDTNPKDSVYPQTRNEIIATPVIYDNKMYIANGQDPEHGEGIGHLYCVDITKTGDVSPELDSPDSEKPAPGGELMAPAGHTYNRKGIPNPNSAVVWRFDKFDLNHDGKFQAEEIMHRTISTVAIADGLVFAPDFSGYLHCLDAKTGQVYWNHSVDAAMWGSPMICDNKLYIGDEAGFVRVFEVGKECKMISEQDMGSPVFCTTVFANGVLFVMTRDHLFAISDKK
jgi:outer membrane protein assembly factor BamB